MALGAVSQTFLKEIEAVTGLPAYVDSDGHLQAPLLARVQVARDGVPFHRVSYSLLRQEPRRDFHSETNSRRFSEEHLWILESQTSRNRRQPSFDLDDEDSSESRCRACPR